MVWERNLNGLRSELYVTRVSGETAVPEEGRVAAVADGGGGLREVRTGLNAGGEGGIKRASLETSGWSEIPREPGRRWRD